MADSSSDHDIAGHAEEGDRESPTGMPRWVKAFLIVGLVLVVLFMIGKVTGLGGEHGPGRHGDSDSTPPSPVGGDHRFPVNHGP